MNSSTKPDITGDAAETILRNVMATEIAEHPDAFEAGYADEQERLLKARGRLNTNGTLTATGHRIHEIADPGDDHDGPSLIERCHDKYRTAPSLRALLLTLKPHARPGHTGPVRCPSRDHEDTNPSASVYYDGKPKWKCHSCGIGGDEIDAIAAHYGLDPRRDMISIADILGVHAPTAPTHAPTAPPRGAPTRDAPTPPPTPSDAAEARAAFAAMFYGGPPIPPPAPLFHDHRGRPILHVGTTVWIYGHGGEGKSWAASTFAAAAAATGTCHAAYLAYEAADETKRRGDKFRPTDLTTSIVVPDPFTVTGELFNLIDEWLDEADHQLVIVDAAYAAGFTSSGESQTAGFAELARWGRLRRRSTQTTVVMDHMPKHASDSDVDAAIGSIEKRNASDAMYRLAGTHDDDGRLLSALLRRTKERGDVHPRRVLVTLTDSIPTARVLTAATDTDDYGPAIADVLADKLSQNAAATLYNVDRKQLGKRVNAARQRDTRK